MSTYLKPPALPNLGIYFDARGYAIVRFTHTENRYQVTAMATSKKCSLELFLVHLANLETVESAYVNSSKLAVHGLSQLGIRAIITDIPTDYDREAPVNLRDTHEILSALITDRKMEICQEHLKSLTTDLSRYEIGDNCHTVLALFYGIGIHAINQQRLTNHRKAYTTGQSYQGYSIAYY